MDAKNYWFSAKPYGNGWGWGPPFTWQGWAVFILFFLSVLAGGVFLAPRSLFAFIVFVAGAAIALIVVCKWKGEPQNSGQD